MNFQSLGFDPNTNFANTMQAPQGVDVYSYLRNNSSMLNNSPWQNQMAGAVNQQAYSSLGLGGNGYQPAGNTGWMANTNNWLSNNSDLLKAGAQVITGGIGAWQGYNQNKLVRQNMEQQASQFREQMNISKTNLNRNIEDRQRARVASNPTAYESVDSYMKKYGVK